MERLGVLVLTYPQALSGAEREQVREEWRLAGEKLGRPLPVLAIFDGGAEATVVEVGSEEDEGEDEDEDEVVDNFLEGITD